MKPLAKNRQEMAARIGTVHAENSHKLATSVEMRPS